MKFPYWLPVYGDLSYRGKCQPESFEQVSFVNHVRQKYPQTYGRIIIHPRNEGLKERGQFSTVAKHAAEGMTKGAADIVIPAAPAFICELKRLDHTKCAWQSGQIEYLEAARATGAFVCVALGAVAAVQAFEEWRSRYGTYRKPLP